MLGSHSDAYLSDEHFLDALRAGATRLTRGGSQAAPIRPKRAANRSVADLPWRVWRKVRFLLGYQTPDALKRQVLLCAQETGLSPKQIRFLLEEYRSLGPNHDALRKTRQDWDRRRVGLPPRDSGRKRIGVVISDGQATRTFLLTDVCRKLTEWADVVILSPLDIAAEVESLGPAATFLPVPFIRRLRFDKLTTYLGYRFIDSPTAAQFLIRLEENFHEARKGGREMNVSLRVWEIARDFQSAEDYRRIYLWSLRFFAGMHALQEASDLLSSLGLDLMLNTSSVSWPSRLWSRAAPLAKIPVVSNVISWDNMSTKTLLDEMSDSYLIWSEEMEEDCARSLPFVRNKPRTIVGSPQFEPIVQGRGLVPREDFAHRHGLSPQKKLILYTTGSKTLFPREAECLDAVLTHWRANLRDHADIMVRMHPKDKQGRYADVMAKFPEAPFTLAGETLADDDEWVPNRDDIALLVNQLHHCDVIVNVASTMTLEGFAIDKPAINIGFALGGVGNARYPMDDYYKSRHYREIVDTGAARLVNNYVELFAAIDAVLDRGEFDVERQRAALRMKCLHIEDSSDRIVAYLKEYAQAGPGSQ